MNSELFSQIRTIMDKRYITYTIELYELRKQQREQENQQQQQQQQQRQQQQQQQLLQKQ